MRLFICLIIILLLQSCNSYPKDARDTLQKVRNDTLKVGVAVHEGWAMIKNGQPEGREVLIAKALAAELNATIEWLVADESELISLLEKAKIHLVIGGLTQKSPWRKYVGFTNPYLKVDNKKHVLAIPPGENAFLLYMEQFLDDYKFTGK